MSVSMNRRAAMAVHLLLVINVAVVPQAHSEPTSQAAISDLPCVSLCNCQLASDVISITCIPQDETKDQFNGTSNDQELNKSVSFKTNTSGFVPETTGSEGGWRETHWQGDFHSIASVNRIYVTGFPGSVTALLRYLNELNISSLREVYLNEPRLFLEEDSLVTPLNVTQIALHHVHISPDSNNTNLDSFLGIFPNLDAVSIRNSNISSISEITFSQVHHVRVVNLSGNKMRTFNNIRVGNVPGLVSLNISHNSLESPLVGCSYSLPSLKQLDISINNIKTTTKALCTNGLLELESLNLSDNSIEVLEEGCFDELKLLRILDLRGNTIGEMRPGCFSCGLSALHSLSLQYNNLTSLHLHTIATLTGLLHLNVSHNNIQVIHTDDYDVKPNRSQCEFEYISFNLLKNRKPFSDVINYWPHIETIDLSHNHIVTINQHHFEEFFKNTKTLLLGNNRINYLPRYGVEQLHRLQVIDLSHNNIDWLDVGSFTNPTLSHIDLSYNKLKKIISMTFLYLPNLQQLNLSHNRLSYLYRLSLYKTCQHSQLMELDLTHNHLAEDATWKFIKTFKEMKSDNCHLSIKLQYNRVRYLLDPASRIRFKEALRTDDSDFLRMLSHTYFNISHNPFHCDCNFLQDLKLIQELNGDLFEQTGNFNLLFKWRYMVCEKPSELQGESVHQARLKLERLCDVHSPLSPLKLKQINCGNGQLQPGYNERSQCINDVTSSYATSTTLAVLCTVLGLMALLCILKKAGLLPKMSTRGRWYKVYSQEDTGSCAMVKIHYQKQDKSLVTGELVYFIQDCCPNHDIFLQPCEESPDTLDHPAGETVTNLFIVSPDLMQEIKTNPELYSHYESIIEQSLVSIFLIMGNRMEIESLYPHFWAKVKYRHNVYFVSGSDKLPKLQCVLKNASSELPDVTVY